LDIEPSIPSTRLSHPPAGGRRVGLWKAFAVAFHKLLEDAMPSIMVDVFVPEDSSHAANNITTPDELAISGTMEPKAWISGRS